ncbi:conserved hypothetical protein [Prochlorococcus marinus str. MIT 9312]|uniref:Uncharacterized protein n=1 Tax=Prochlorococcus marinus (strain MIT 9312) TaxID=74546 RepID=Q31BH9_PROM9|nr:hypothetical protein [Prochlorococcus marinus]ABB49766.1 conserved hypothetical protein [Prochlorococcus marinus str. MIT 9312]KGF99257.1 hypothetical protein EU97_1815 [Prochlorococcus marinus str. MIT 9311]
MDVFIITSFTKDISRIDLIGILLGHVIFAIALTQLLDWTWLKNLMSEEDKRRMLKSYTWKDLLVDGAIVTVVLGIIFLIISIFL